MTITNELLEKEIIRLREENEKLKDQVEFVCKNREIIQKSYAALEEKYNSFVDNATEINMGLLHVRAKVGSYPGVMVSLDTIDDEQLIAFVEYNKDSGKIQVSTYDENSDEPRTIYEMKTNLKEKASECRREVTECKAILNHEACREEDPYEVITAREEFELEKKIEICNEFYDKFVKFTGEEVRDMNVEIRITEKGMKNIETFLRECKAKRKELLDAGKDTAENVVLPVYADVADAIEPTEDGIWTETFGVTDHTDLTIRLDEGIDFTAMLI